MFNTSSQRCQSVPGGGALACILPRRKCREGIPPIMQHPNKNLQRYYIACFQKLVLVAICDQVYNEKQKRCVQHEPVKKRTILVRNECKYSVPVVMCRHAGKISANFGRYQKNRCKSCQFICGKRNDTMYELKILC